jgi:hypothetical protein
VVDVHRYRRRVELDAAVLRPLIVAAEGSPVSVSEEFSEALVETAPAPYGRIASFYMRY